MKRFSFIFNKHQREKEASFFQPKKEASLLQQTSWKPNIENPENLTQIEKQAKNSLLAADNCYKPSSKITRKLAQNQPSSFSLIIKGALSGATFEEASKNRNQEEGKATLSDYRILGKKLGQGAYAIVRPAVSQKNGELVAIKTYDRHKLVNKKKRDAVKNEISVMRILNHPYIVSFVDVIENRRNTHIVMEHGGTQNLQMLLNKKKLSKPNILKLFKQVVEATSYLHSMGIVHRDLKIDNICVSSEGIAKLVDFGFAIQTQGKEQRSICGTPNFMSPELCRRMAYDGCKTDTWALGVILYFLLAGKYPFVGKSEPELIVAIMTCKPDYSCIQEEEEKDLLRKIFVKNQGERISATLLLEHPLLKKIYSKGTKTYSKIL